MSNKDIEEDIKTLESMIEEYKNCSVPEVDMQVDITFRERQAQAIENILADREKLKEENIRLLAKGLLNNLEENKKHKEDLDNLNEGWKIEVKELQTKANKYDSLVSEIKKYCTNNIKQLNCGEILSIRGILKDILDLLETIEGEKK